MIRKTLEEIGFYENEVEVYLELLRIGKARPSALAKATGLKRSTVYSVVDTLLEKGVITEDLAGKSRYLVALPPDDLTNLIKKDAKLLNRKKRLVHKAIDELALLPTGTQYSVPQIRFIEDENIEDHLYKETPKWHKSLMKKDNVWWGFQDPTLVENYKDWILWHWSVSPEEIELKLITSESDIERQMVKESLKRRQIRFWKKGLDFTATTWVAGDYLIMIYTNERPFYLIEIHNPVLAHNMREVFKGIWKDLERKA